MKTLKVAVIGTGFIGKQHIEAIRRIPGTEIVAVIDNNEKMARSVAEQFFISRYYKDYKELLANTDVDVIHNCTPSAMHYPISKEVIKSGKHVYCEKPLTLNSTESEELVKLAKEYKVAAGANFNYRQNAMVQEMNQRVMNGSIGRLLTVYGEYMQDWMLFDTDYDWRLDPKLGGESRAIADIGSHCFDTIQFICGKRITSVYANLTTVHTVRKKMEKTDGTFSAATGKVLEEIPIRSEDMAYIMVKFEDGMQGLFHVSQVAAGKKNAFKINVCGAASSLEWNQERPDKLWIGHRDSGNEELYVGAQYMTGEAKKYATLPNGHPVGWADALRNGIHNFYDSIQNNNYINQNQNYVTFEDANYIMKIVEACLRSNQSQKWEDVLQ
ncbi:MAG: Gfo/Idh/MocA family oxidoreductase [Clostridiales bacterium]|nr:Gfo/Idh/MocA family oxidoreductase [Clostridiales bacterium]